MKVDQEIRARSHPGGQIYLYPGVIYDAIYQIVKEGRSIVQAMWHPGLFKLTQVYALWSHNFIKILVPK